MRKFSPISLILLAALLQLTSGCKSDNPADSGGKGKLTTSASLDFGVVVPPAFKTASLVLTNSGTSELEIQSHKFSSALFSLDLAADATAKIAVGASKTIAIKYTPQDTLAITAYDTIRSDGETPITIIRLTAGFGSGGTPGAVINVKVVTDAPDVMSANIEPVWSTATAMTVNADAMGFTGRVTRPVSIKSVHTATDIYLLVEYKDADMNMMSQPLNFKGGDFLDTNQWSRDLSTFSDGFSFMFEKTPGTSGSKTFSKNGCTMACHETRTVDWDPGMFPETGGEYDIWMWRAEKSNATGLAEDYMSQGGPIYANEKDDNNAEYGTPNVLKFAQGYLPYLVPAHGNRGLDNHFFIAAETAEPFGATTSVNPITGSPWAANDILPALTVGPLTPDGQDYYDVKAKGYYSATANSWTIKFKRKLSTGQVKDVIFESGKTYLFSFALHDNSAPGHHYGVADKSFELKLE